VGGAVREICTAPPSFSDSTGMIDRPTPAHNPWPFRLAALTAATTLILILMGGLVTNTGSALAVPDWPTTFGQNMFLFPWEKMVGGVFYEHTHRLLGSLVGLLTVGLAVLLWRTDSRRSVRILGFVAVLAVIFQGVLGGMRVVLLENGLALIHGCFAQAFLALIVTLAVVTSRFWHAAADEPPIVATSKLRTLVRVLVPLVYAQLVFGAILTHTGQRLDAHLLFAGMVTLGVALLVTQVFSQEAQRSALRRPAVVLVALVGMQLSLGLAAYLWRFTTMSAEVPGEVGLAILAAHRLTGTAIWATSILLCLRVLRLFAVRPTTAAPLSTLSPREVWA